MRRYGLPIPTLPGRPTVDFEGLTADGQIFRLDILVDRTPDALPEVRRRRAPVTTRPKHTFAVDLGPHISASLTERCGP